MSGYSIEFWPGTADVKSVTAVEDEKNVLEGCSFLPEGSPIPEAVPAALTNADKIALAMLERDRLLGVAALRINPLQYAIDLGVATEAEKESLRLWKIFSLEVNRVVGKPLFPEGIEWPAEPS
ncbi:tail fiber assembly protein [Pseudomonas fluorescens]|uniref:tail fiber assembly protein n=1 Tax=Pseudomonas fluorescens TaxID=294 RepID=UPI00372D81E0